jgi:glycosyltransferase involved in cell wall biosynthesis
VRILLLYDYPAGPGGLATQGDLLYKGLREIGIDVQPVNYQAAKEKEWYYRWFKPDVAVGIGYWGYAPHLVLHPQLHGIPAVPWLVADGYIANYLDVLNALPLILVTSSWVKEVYARDGLRPELVEVLPVGCDTEAFVPRGASDPRVSAVRQALGIGLDELMVLTVGGDAASKGAQEVMRALALLGPEAPPWKYVCKVWPQERTRRQNQADLQLAFELGIDQNLIYIAEKMSRNIMPYLTAACDIYAAPSRLEGFGMPHVEAGACGKPVLAMRAMAFLDTLVHDETALLARPAREIFIGETVAGPESGYEEGHRIVFERPRVVEYQADVDDVARCLRQLMDDPDLRRRMGAAGRARAVERFDYRVVARRLVEILSARLGLG